MIEDDFTDSLIVDKYGNFIARQYYMAELEESQKRTLSNLLVPILWTLFTALLASATVLLAMDFFHYCGKA